MNVSMSRLKAMSLLVGALLCVSGCQSSNVLGEDFETMSLDERVVRCCEILSEVFEGGVDGEGLEFSDRVVQTCDLDRIVYTREGKRAELTWEDVKRISGKSNKEIDDSPETIHVHLNRNSESSDSLASDTGFQFSKMAKQGVSNPYLVLESREPGSRVKLGKAWGYLRKMRGVREKNAIREERAAMQRERRANPRNNPRNSRDTRDRSEWPPAEDRRTQSSQSDDERWEEVREKIRILTEMRDAGEITEAEFQEKRKVLVDELK